MVTPAYRSLLIVSLAALNFACNFEIGNPEPPPPSGKIETLYLSLAKYSQCESQSTSCTSTPVKLAHATDSTYTMEMTRIQLQLQNLRLKPFAQQSVQTSVNLLEGTHVSIPSEPDASNITGAELLFAPNHQPTFEIHGQLRVSDNSGTYTVPLRFSDLEAIETQSDFSAGGSNTVNLLFDTDLWFDFSGDNPDISNAMRNLTSGPCRNGTSAQCEGFRNQLSRQISRKIARSMSAGKVD
ncbi:MAG: hypothetical protein ACOY5B_07390 [Spirochaetota bacterium]